MRRYVRPLLKLTAEQVVEILKRAFQKKGTSEAAKLEAAQWLLREVEPPARQVMARVWEKAETIPKLRYLPPEEALELVTKQPERYRSAWLPTEWKEVAMPTGQASPTPEELAKEIAYRQVRLTPLFSRGEKTGLRTRKELLEEEVARYYGLAPEEAPTRAKLLEEIATKEQFTPMPIAATERLEKKIPTIEETVRLAGLAEYLWKEAGGKRGLTGKLFERYKNSSPGRFRGLDTRDYFVSSFVRYATKPEEFRRRFPREAKIFDGLLESIGKEVETFKIPPTTED